MDKKLLRAEIKKKNSCLSEEYKKEASEKITALLLSSSLYKNAKSIFIYISRDNEPDTEKIIEAAFSDNKTVYVPKCISDGIMLPIRINRKTELYSGYKGIKEPEITVYPEENTSPDISVIPSVSASYDGKRLGHGGGFYDRFLQNTETYRICLCFNKLIVSDIPTESHDAFMDAVITENKIYNCRK